MRRSGTVRSLIAALLVAAGPSVAVGALFQDIERHKASAVRRVLDTGEEYRYSTPPAMAVMKRSSDAAVPLLERGANPRIKSPAGDDVLGFARKFNRADLISLLECAVSLGPGERFAERCPGASGPRQCQRRPAWP
jgi:hypothetical protein